MTWRLLAISLLAPVVAAAANVGHELAAAHARRAGGRTAQVGSLQAEGRTLVNDEVLEFRLWARRPDQLRVETGVGDRRVTQVFDGRHEPVVTHSGANAGRPMRMAAAERKEFIANADFDGPLVNFAAKGYTVDYAGEDHIGGRVAKKLLVMSALDDVFFLWLDAETHEIVKRAVFRIVGERRLLVETLFSDFRDVGGVPQPHRVETKIGDRTLYLMVVTRITANAPEVTDAVFAVPEGWPEWMPAKGAETPR